MKVFCPNCGSDNEGNPGGRATCRQCAASFEVPGETPFAPPVTGQGAPSAWGAPPAVVQPPPQVTTPPGYAQPSYGTSGVPPMYSKAQEFGSPTFNTLAVISLVSGIVCCIPFSGIIAVVTGFMGMKQIDQSNGMQKGRELAIAGIIIGALSMLAAFGFFVLGVIGNATK